MLLVVRLSADTVRDWISTHGARVLLIVIVFLVARAVVHRIVPPAVQQTMLRGVSDGETAERRKRAETLSMVLVRLASTAMLVVAVFIVLGEVGYNLTPVVAGLGISGIAIGLGAQSLVKDTINGIFILAENQFRVGDAITVAGVAGVVEDITLRRTVLRDFDGTVHSIPNSAIIVSSNHTRDYAGVNVTVLIPRSTDLERALTVATEVGKQVQAQPDFAGDVVEPPRPVRIESIDATGVTFRVLGKVRPSAVPAVTFAYRRRLTEALDAAGLGSSVAPAAPPAAPPPPPAG